MEHSVITDEGEVLVFSPWSFDTKPQPAPIARLENLYIESGPFERVVSATPVMSDIEFVNYMTTDLDDMPPLT
jgi:hypothetical protein